MSADRMQADVARSLRLLRLSDVELLTAYHQRNAEFHAPWSPLLPPEFATLNYQIDRLHGYFSRQAIGLEYRFGIFTAAPLLIGCITLTAIEQEPFLNGRLGYSMDQQFINQGILTENLRWVMRFAFETVRLHRLEANLMPRNQASRRVLEKSGFQPIGHAPKYLQIQGIWEDHDLYAALAPWV